jgi:hypothetical protein
VGKYLIIRVRFPLTTVKVAIYSSFQKETKSSDIAKREETKESIARGVGCGERSIAFDDKFIGSGEAATEFADSDGVRERAEDAARGDVQSGIGIFSEGAKYISWCARLEFGVRHDQYTLANPQ